MAKRPAAPGMKRAKDQSVNVKLRHSEFFDGVECGGRLYVARTRGYYLCATCDGKRDALVHESKAGLDMGQAPRVCEEHEKAPLGGRCDYCGSNRPIPAVA